MYCIVLHCIAVCGSVWQCVEVFCSVLHVSCPVGTHVLQYIALRSSVGQRAAACSSVLQCKLLVNAPTAPVNILYVYIYMWDRLEHSHNPAKPAGLQLSSSGCSVLQRVAARCSVVQCVAVCFYNYPIRCVTRRICLWESTRSPHCNVLQHTATDTNIDSNTSNGNTNTDTDTDTETDHQHQHDGDTDTDTDTDIDRNRHRHRHMPSIWYRHGHRDRHGHRYRHRHRRRHRHMPSTSL